MSYVENKWPHVIFSKQLPRIQYLLLINWWKMSESSLGHYVILLPWFCFVPNGGFMITVSTFLNHGTDQHEEIFHSLATAPCQNPRHLVDIGLQDINVVNIKFITVCLEDVQCIWELTYHAECCRIGHCRLVTSPASSSTAQQMSQPIRTAPIDKTPHPHPKSITILSEMSAQFESAVCSMHAENIPNIYVYLQVTLA